MTLNDRIASLASEFARSLVASLKTASLSELVDMSGATAGTARAAVKLAIAPKKSNRGWATRQWPKCPVCGKNAHPQGKGYCFEHSKSGGKKSVRTTSKAARKVKVKTAKTKSVKRPAAASATT